MKNLNKYILLSIVILFVNQKLTAGPMNQVKTFNIKNNTTSTIYGVALSCPASLNNLIAKNVGPNGSVSFSGTAACTSGTVVVQMLGKNGVPLPETPNKNLNFPLYSTITINAPDKVVVTPK